MVGSPDSVQKNVVLENNSLSAEQITGVENRKSKAGEAVLPVLRSVSLFLYFLSNYSLCSTPPKAPFHIEKGLLLIIVNFNISCIGRYRKRNN